MPQNYLYVKPKSPPSSYAIAALIEREPNALEEVIKVTLKRSLFIAPGLYLSGIKDTQLVKSSIIGSISISVMLYFYYLNKKNG